MGSKYDIERTSLGKPAKDDCRCSRPVGLLLLLLLVVTAVAIGLIVHFAKKADDAEARCDGGDRAMYNETFSSCLAMARAKDEQICGACQGMPSDSSTTTTTTSTTTTAPPPMYPIRLPGSMAPISYRLTLRPEFYSGNKSEFNLYGSVSVLVTCLEETNEIRMHLKGLHLAENSIFVTEENGVENMFASYELYTPNDLIMIRTNTMLARGSNYTVEFTEFWAPISTNLFAFYLGEFMQNGEKVYHVATQMEPTFAREVFPCFDEPALKATFDVTLVRKSHVISISNMPLADSNTMSDGWIADRFEVTPVMPTYLLNFIIGDFTNTSVMYKDEFPISVWSRDEAADDRAFALEISPTLQEYFEDLFGVGYYLPKLDMIGLQSFAFGGMENWGAYTFREELLLYGQGSTLKAKFLVIAVIAHEISHNWFGNLVSPAWWDDLWLNEAFASYMEILGINVIDPAWKPFDMFVADVYKYAMTFDEKVSSHPIYVEGLEKSDDIFAVFDDIVYIKGGQMVRMLANLVGDDIFSQGLHRYMTAHAFGNTRHQDLWDAIQAEADVANSSIPDIRDMMSTWIFQMGFPTVHVQFTEDGRLNLSQSRYLKDRTAQDPGIYTSEYGYTWDIPFTFTSSSETNFDLPAEIYLMNHTKDSVVVESGRVPSPTGDNWVIGNLQTLAFAQVNYDQRNWDAIINQLKQNHTVIHPINRIQLIHDSWNLVKSGDLSLDTALRLAEYIRHEREFGPWWLLTGEWRYIFTMLHGNKLSGRFTSFLRDSIREAYYDFSAMPTSSLGYSEVRAKATVVSYACGSGLQECIDNTTSVLADWMADPHNKPSEFETDMAEVLLCNGVRHGGAAEFDFLLEVYLNSSQQSERSRIIQALGCTPHLWLVDRYLSLCFDEDVISSSDVYQAIRSMTSSRTAVFVWDYVRTYYDTIQSRLGNYFTGLIIDLIANHFNTEIRLRELESFVQERGIADHPSVLNGLASTRGNIQWMADSAPVLQDWLEQNGY